MLDKRQIVPYTEQRSRTLFLFRSLRGWENDTSELAALLSRSDFDWPHRSMDDASTETARIRRE
jgi:hypothetical protein